MRIAKITPEDFQVQIGTFCLYRCAACRGYDIKESYSFCPFCGAKLIFEEIYSEKKKRGRNDKGF